MNIRRWSIAGLFCITVFSTLAVFKLMEIKSAIAFAESFPEQSETVEISLAKKVSRQEHITVLGEAVATQSVTLRNELPGTIVAVNYRSAERVEKDQILMQLDVSQEKANLRAAKARVNLAKSVYQRAYNLFRSKAVSREQLDTAIADLAALEAEVEAINSSIRKKTIKAPFAGIASIHQFEVGQFLPDNSLITTIVGDDNAIWVDFNVPQFYQPLTTDSEIKIERIGFFNEENEQTTGTLVAVDQTINNVSRSRLYRAKVNTTHFPLSPNAAVSVSVPVGPSKPLIAIAATGVQQDNLGQFVYRLEPNDQGDGFRAKRTKVTVTTKADGLAFIGKGLNANDKIAAAGAFKLQEGMLVFSRERQLDGTAHTASRDSLTKDTAGAL